MLHQDVQHAPLGLLLLTALGNQRRSFGPLQASSKHWCSLCLKGSLLLRSSFSTSAHLLPAPPGTEHRLETCSYGSKITEERWPSLHWTVQIYGGFHRPLWRQEGQWKAISRRKSPRGLAPLRAFPVEYIWFAASASSLLMLGKTCGWCPGCSECTCLYSFPAKHSSKKEAS